jgi:hypothetical protein
MVDIGILSVSGCGGKKITLELAMQRTKGRLGLLVFTRGLTVFALA